METAAKKQDLDSTGKLVGTSSLKPPTPPSGPQSPSPSSSTSTTSLPLPPTCVQPPKKFKNTLCFTIGMGPLLASTPSMEALLSQLPPQFSLTVEDLNKCKTRPPPPPPRGSSIATLSKKKMPLLKFEGLDFVLHGTIFDGNKETLDARTQEMLHNLATYLLKVDSNEENRMMFVGRIDEKRAATITAVWRDLQKNNGYVARTFLAKLENYSPALDVASIAQLLKNFPTESEFLRIAAGKQDIVYAFCLAIGKDWNYAKFLFELFVECKKVYPNVRQMNTHCKMVKSGTEAACGPEVAKLFHFTILMINAANEGTSQPAVTYFKLEKFKTIMQSKFKKESEMSLLDLVASSYKIPDKDLERVKEKMRGLEVAKDGATEDHCNKIEESLNLMDKLEKNLQQQPALWKAYSNILKNGIQEYKKIQKNLYKTRALEEDLRKKLCMSPETMIHQVPSLISEVLEMVVCARKIPVLQGEESAATSPTIFPVKPKMTNKRPSRIPTMSVLKVPLPSSLPETTSSYFPLSTSSLLQLHPYQKSQMTESPTAALIDTKTQAIFSASGQACPYAASSVTRPSSMAPTGSHRSHTKTTSDVLFQQPMGYMNKPTKLPRLKFLTPVLERLGVSRPTPKLLISSPVLTGITPFSPNACQLTPIASAQSNKEDFVHEQMKLNKRNPILSSMQSGTPNRILTKNTTPLSTAPHRFSPLAAYANLLEDQPCSSSALPAAQLSAETDSFPESDNEYEDTNRDSTSDEAGNYLLHVKPDLRGGWN